MGQITPSTEGNRNNKITLSHFDKHTLFWAAIGFLTCISPLFIDIICNIDFSSKKTEIVEEVAEPVEEKPVDIWTGNYTGTGMINGKYPIRIELNLTPGYASEWEVEGRYAYENTIKKVGNGAASWLNLRGAMDDKGHMELSSTNGDDTLIEEIRLTLDKTGTSTFTASGEMTNQLNYKDFTIEIACKK